MTSKKKVYFLCFNRLPFLPYAYGVLRAYAEQDPEIRDAYQFADPFFLHEDSRSVIDRIEAPSVLALSCYMWNFRKQMSIAKQVKEKFPGVLVIAGGPHIPKKSDTFLEEFPFIDIVVHDEGEIPFARILAANTRGVLDLSEIPNISYLVGGKTVRSKNTVMLPRQIETLSPYLAGYFDTFFEAYPRQKFFALWETNRGCPYHCSFCDWGSNEVDKIRTIGIPRLQNEIRYFAERALEEVYICDANFGILERDKEITEYLVDTKKRFGYPASLRITFAKNSNDRVFDVSKRLADAEMLWGTTLTMQSMDSTVLDAIQRKNIKAETYQSLIRRYNEHGIPVYSEFILGLPRETKQSFVTGVCEIFEIGNHDNLRVYELSVLPNAPMNLGNDRELYGLKMKPKKIFHPEPFETSEEFERVDIVYETNTLPFSDWVYCNVFGDLVQTLHNGGYTRFLSIFLREGQQLPYRDFYSKLCDYFYEKPDSVLGFVLHRISRLHHDYIVSDHIASIHKLVEKDMLEFLAVFSTKRGFFNFEWIWLYISQYIDDFYEQLFEFLTLKMGQTSRDLLDDILRFQKDIMLRPEYDPKIGKKRVYSYSWYDYFTSGQKTLLQQENVIHYRDTHLGLGHRFKIEKDNYLVFVHAALGGRYPFSKFRHYYHQFDKMTVSEKLLQDDSEQRQEKLQAELI